MEQAKTAGKLSEEVMQRIAAEEGFRLSIRKKLEKDDKPDSDSKVMKFLNSPFGLFLLTTILVSGLGTVWASWNEQRKEKQTHLEVEKKLMVEFDYRLYTVDTWISHIVGSPDPQTKGMYTILIYRAATGDSFAPTLPEFKEPWAGVVSQLNSLGVSDHFADAMHATVDLADGQYPYYSPRLPNNGGYLGYFAPDYYQSRSKALHEFSATAWKKIDPDHHQ